MTYYYLYTIPILILSLSFDKQQRQYAFRNIEDYVKLLFAPPLGGIVGFFEGIPLFVFIPIILMLIMMNASLLTKNDFLYYVLPCLPIIVAIDFYFIKIPLFIFLPTIILAFVIGKIFFFKKQYFLYYTMSLFIAYTDVFVYAYNADKIKLSFYRGFSDYVKVNMMYVTIPALLITILINWFVFKKSYKTGNVSHVALKT
jgi:hypothetical protein